MKAKHTHLFDRCHYGLKEKRPCVGRTDIGCGHSPKRIYCKCGTRRIKNAKTKNKVLK